MSVNMDGLQGVFAVLVSFGTALVPVVFAILQVIKPLLGEGVKKLLPIIAIVLGGLIGAGLTALAPQLGVEGINYATGIIGGLIGGYIATTQYDSGVKSGIQKVESQIENKEEK